MFKVKEETTLFGLSELRSHLAEILKAVKEGNVILTKRNKPILAVLDYARYCKISEFIEEIEDLYLGILAQERLTRKGRKTISLSEAMKRVGL